LVNPTSSLRTSGSTRQHCWPGWALGPHSSDQATSMPPHITIPARLKRRDRIDGGRDTATIV
jgi:hypothetical protein